MKKGWELVIHEPSMRVILGASSRERTKVFRLFERLAENPYVKGDFVEQDDSGRSLEVVHTGAWAVAFWLDSSVKEVRIVRVGRIESKT